jgi:type IV secretory pathway VirJ component
MVKLIRLPSAHHYNGEYDKLDARIVTNLSAKK